MATANELVTWAQSQIGVKESPANSNRVKYWDDYRRRCGVDYNGQPWCAAFVTDGMCQIGQWVQTSDEGRFRYCPSLVSWAKQQGEWLGREAVCEPGDIILFANGSIACHVGIVEKRLSASQVQTIEGNTSVTSNDNGGAVMRRTRTYGSVGSSWYILGFVRPKWEDEVTPQDIEAIADKAAEKVWNFIQDGWNGPVKMRDRLLGIDGKTEILTDTSDPTKRVEGMSIHDQVRYMAEKQQAMFELLQHMAQNKS